MDHLFALAAANPAVAFVVLVGLTAVFATWASKNL